MSLKRGLKIISKNDDYPDRYTCSVIFSIFKMKYSVDVNMDQLTELIEDWY